MSITTNCRDYWINPRLKIAALWTSMLFVFAYADLFTMYRSDVRADLKAGTIAIFTIGQGYLLGVTVYVALPSLMLFLSLAILPRWPEWRTSSWRLSTPSRSSGAPSGSGTTSSSGVS